MQKHEPLNAQAHCATTDWNILKWHEMTCLELQVAYCCNEHIPFGKPQLFMTELQIEPSRPWYSLGYCTGSRIHITCTSPKWGMRGQNEDAKTLLHPKRISEGLLSALALGKTWIHLATDTRITKDNVQKMEDALPVLTYSNHHLKSTILVILKATLTILDPQHTHLFWGNCVPMCWGNILQNFP